MRSPRGATKADWEVELGIVIGRRTSYLDSVEAAEDAIAGWGLVNDVSERAFQMERGGQWVKGKSAETFNPAGPYIVTRDEVANVLDLGMWLDVNGLSVVGFGAARTNSPDWTVATSRPRSHPGSPAGYSP